MCEPFDHGSDDILAPGVAGADLVTHIKDVFPILGGEVLVSRFGYGDSQYEAPVRLSSIPLTDDIVKDVLLGPKHDRCDVEEWIDNSRRGSGYRNGYQSIRTRSG